MLIRLGYDIRFDIKAPVPIDRAAEGPSLPPPRPARAGRGPHRAGGECREYRRSLRQHQHAVHRRRRDRAAGEQHRRSRIRASRIRSNPDAREVPVGELPPDTLRYLMGSRFCEVDLLSPAAAELFGHVPRGWARVQAICEWVHSKVTFSYAQARPTRTALDVFTERVGVCRDFQHLAITFCRCLNIPARYTAGYLGRHRRAADGSDGLQRLVRGLSRGSLVDVRRPPQQAADRPRR